MSGRWTKIQKGKEFMRSSILTLKLLGEGVNLSPDMVFRIYLLKRVRNPVFSVTFNIIISQIFPKNFIEIHQVVQKI